MAVIFYIDTELPPATTLADNTANPTVPGVGSFNMVFDGTTWDRASAISLVDSDTGAGTVLIPQINLVRRASGGPVEIGIDTSELYVRHKGVATYADNQASSDFQPVYSFNMNYNRASSTWYYQCAAVVGDHELTTGNGLTAVGLYGYYNATPQALTTNYFGNLHCTEYRGLHINLRNASGTEVGTSASPIYASPGVSTGSKRTPAAPATINGGGVGTQIVAATSTRKCIVITNTGSNPLYLGKDNTVTSTVYTIVLLSNQIFVDDYSSDAWFGNTTNAASTTVAYEEIT